jgi:HD-like signal output (HDOD) protein
MPDTAFQKVTISERLPSPSGIALKLIQLARDESTPMSAIVHCVHSDPALTIQILKMANSAANAASTRVGSVATAVRLLGLAKVKQAALSFSLTASLRAGQCKAFDYDSFWSGSLARSVAARYLAEKFKLHPPDEAFVCGLLSQIGKLALACVFPKPYEGLCEIKDESELRSRERQLFGVDHSDMNAQLTRSWGMPEQHVLAVRHQHDPNSAGSELDPDTYALTSLLHVSEKVASVLIANKNDAKSIGTLCLHRPLIGMSNEAVEAILTGIATEWASSGEMFSIKTNPYSPATC